MPIPGNSHESAELVDLYRAAGWEVRLSGKNHWIAKSPNKKFDGTPFTNGWSTNIYGVSAKKARNDLGRWCETFPDLIPQSSRPTKDAHVEPTAPGVLTEIQVRSPYDGAVRVVEQTLDNGAKRHACAQCGWIGGSYRSVAQHYAGAHTDRQIRGWEKRRKRLEAVPDQPQPEERPTLDEQPSDAESKLAEIRRIVQSADVAELQARLHALEQENAQLHREREEYLAERSALRDLLA